MCDSSYCHLDKLPHKVGDRGKCEVWRSIRSMLSYSLKMRNASINPLKLSAWRLLNFLFKDKTSKKSKSNTNANTNTNTNDNIPKSLQPQIPQNLLSKDRNKKKQINQNTNNLPPPHLRAIPSLDKVNPPQSSNTSIVPSKSPELELSPSSLKSPQKPSHPMISKQINPINLTDSEEDADMNDSRPTRKNRNSSSQSPKKRSRLRSRSKKPNKSPSKPINKNKNKDRNRSRKSLNTLKP